MYVSMNKQRHYCERGDTFIVTYRVKAWKFMEHVAHNCVDKCQEVYKETTISYNKRFVKKLRAQDFPEWLLREPSEEEFETWEHFRVERKLEEELEMFNEIRKRLEAEEQTEFDKLRKLLEGD